MTTFVAWIHRFYRQLGKEHKQIARGVVTVALFALMGKSVAALKEIVIAWRYGISATVDAYLFVFSLAQWPVTLFYGIISAVLIPLSARIRQDSPEELSRFGVELFAVTVAVGLGLGFLAWVGLPLLMEQPWVGLNSVQQVVAVRFAPWFAWLIPLGMIYALQATWIMAENRHVNTLLDSLPALTLLIAVGLAGGIFPLVVGVLSGFALRPIFLSLMLCHHRKLNSPVWSIRSSWWQTFGMAIAAMLVGQFLQSLIGIADQFFAARLGSGELSTLGYSNRILALVNAIGAMAVGRAILPVLSHRYAQGKPIHGIVVRWAVLCFLIGIGVSLAGGLFASDIVRLLFQRGAFQIEDTFRVAKVLRIAFLQLPVYFGGLVIVYGLLSQGRQQIVAILAGINLVVKMVVGWLLVFYLRQGLSGLMFSTAIVYLISLLCASFFFRAGQFRLHSGG